MIFLNQPEPGASGLRSEPGKHGPGRRGGCRHVPVKRRGARPRGRRGRDVLSGRGEVLVLLRPICLPRRGGRSPGTLASGCSGISVRELLDELRILVDGIQPNACPTVRRMLGDLLVRRIDF